MAQPRLNATDRRLRDGHAVSMTAIVSKGSDAGVWGGRLSVERRERQASTPAIFFVQVGFALSSMQGVCNQWLRGSRERQLSRQIGGVV